MKLVDRFRFWIAEPLLEQLRREHEMATTARQSEAYQLGHETGYSKGRVHGQLEGQQYLLSELSRYQGERKARLPEVTDEDLERAKKGLVH